MMSQSGREEAAGKESAPKHANGTRSPHMTDDAASSKREANPAPVSSSSRTTRCSPGC